MDAQFAQRGFLPQRDPARHFVRYPELSLLDQLGRDLPDLLQDPRFRRRAKEWDIPSWPEDELHSETLAELRLYYVRLGFLASAYVNQVSQPGANLLPRSIAVPLWRACRLLRRPPILSYDGYALYNWKRLDPAGPIALGNIDTIQNFVPLYDEHRAAIEEVEAMPSIRGLADKDRYNDVLEAIATFREVHCGWAQEYVNRRVHDPRGTGGTPYMKWLRQLIDETRGQMLH